MSWEPEIEELKRRLELAKRMGGPDNVRRQHAGGKLTVLMPSRILTGVLLAFVAVASGQPGVVVVEDWSRHPVGATGIPDGWKPQNWGGSPVYDMTVVEESAIRVLHLKSRAQSSTINKEVKVNAKDTPILEWRWKTVALPTGGDCRQKATDDQAVQVYVTFPRFPSLVRSRIIGYIWDTTAPEGTIVQSQKTSLITYVVVRSGGKDLNRWITESRNVYEDYKRIYKEEPGELNAVSVAIDSDDTNSSAESYVGAILFKKP